MSLNYIVKTKKVVIPVSCLKRLPVASQYFHLLNVFVTLRRVQRFWLFSIFHSKDTHIDMSIPKIPACKGISLASCSPRSVSSSVPVWPVTRASCLNASPVQGHWHDLDICRHSMVEQTIRSFQLENDQVCLQVKGFKVLTLHVCRHTDRTHNAHTHTVGWLELVNILI